MRQDQVAARERLLVVGAHQGDDGAIQNRARGSLHGARRGRAVALADADQGGHGDGGDRGLVEVRLHQPVPARRGQRLGVGGQEPLPVAG